MKMEMAPKGAEEEQEEEKVQGKGDMSRRKFRRLSAGTARMAQ